MAPIMNHGQQKAHAWWASCARGIGRVLSSVLCNDGVMIQGSRPYARTPSMISRSGAVQFRPGLTLGKVWLHRIVKSRRPCRSAGALNDGAANQSPSAFLKVSLPRGRGTFCPEVAVSWLRRAANRKRITTDLKTFLVRPSI